MNTRETLEHYFGENLKRHLELSTKMKEYEKRLPTATAEEKELLNIAISGCLAQLDALDQKIGRAVTGVWRFELTRG